MISIKLENLVWVQTQLETWFQLHYSPHTILLYPHFLYSTLDITCSTSTLYNILREKALRFDQDYPTSITTCDTIPADYFNRLYQVGFLGQFSFSSQITATSVTFTEQRALRITRPFSMEEIDLLRFYQLLTQTTLNHRSLSQTLSQKGVLLIELLRPYVTDKYIQLFKANVRTQTPEFKDNTIPFTLLASGALSQPSSFYYAHADLLRRWANMRFRRLFPRAYTRLCVGQYFFVKPNSFPVITKDLLPPYQAEHHDYYEAWINIASEPQQCYIYEHTQPENADMCDTIHLVMPGEMVIFSWQQQHTDMSFNPRTNKTMFWLQCFFIVYHFKSKDEREATKEQVNQELNRMREQHLPILLNSGQRPFMYLPGTTDTHLLDDAIKPLYKDSHGKTPRYLDNTASREASFDIRPYQITPPLQSS